jgi:adenine-specific DNA methylase
MTKQFHELTMEEVRAEGWQSTMCCDRCGCRYPVVQVTQGYAAPGKKFKVKTLYLCEECR